MRKNISKNYKQEWERDVYRKWEESGYFNPDNLPDRHKEHYGVAMPPPNVTGVLHLGHALENTIMDTKVRYQRMKGKKVLLLPGTDHAAVATQAKVEKILQKRGMADPRKELGREKLLNEIREFAEKSKSIILSQIRTLGTSCDWSRLAYTFDEQRNRAVNEIFVKMYNDGLIYKGFRTVNWSVAGQSTLSDDEVEYSQEVSKLFTFKYSQDFPIAIATTRPETKLGDNAVAVNPNDKRYKELIGKEYMVDIGAEKRLKIKIIGDEKIDKNFGTGALGVTTAHSHIDYEIYQKNPEIGMIAVIGKDGKMTERAGKEYCGLTVDEARQKFVNWLKTNNLLINEEEITHNIGRSDRYKDIVEILPMQQWFIDVNKEIAGRGKSLKELMKEAVEKKIDIQPKRFEKIYFDWIDNLRDWCISRQIWWGHRIPVWYKQSKTHQMKIYGEEMFDNLQSGKKKYETRAFKQRFNEIEQGENIEFILVDKNGEQNLGKKLKKRVSKIYRFDNVEQMCNQLGVENIAPGLNLNELKSWYIENILNFEQRVDKGGLIAFELVNIEDEIYVGLEAPKGENWEQDGDTLDTWFSSGTWTFSTLGWPEETNDFKNYHPTAWMQMGYEILFFWMARMILVSSYAIGEVPFRKVYIHGMLRDKQGRKFSKSLGNGKDPIEVINDYGADALRLSLIKGMTAGNDGRFYEEKVIGARNFINKLWNISRFIFSSGEANENKDIWQTKAESDKWILDNLNRTIKLVTLEMDKNHFSKACELIYDFTWNKLADWYIETAKVENDKQEILVYVLKNVLKMWHPFCPFVSEKIWESFSKEKMLMIETWPIAKEIDLTNNFEIIINLINQIRSFRADYKISAVKIIELVIESGEFGHLIEDNQKIIEKLARVKIISTGNKGEQIKLSMAKIDMYLQLDGVLDIGKEIKRIDNEIEKMEILIERIARQLANRKFMEKAASKIVESTKERYEEYSLKLEKLKRQRNKLGNI